jgi:hypothetical protein
MYVLPSVVRLSSLGHCCGSGFASFWDDGSATEWKAGSVSVSQSTDGSGSASTQNLEAGEAQNGAMDDHWPCTLTVEARRVCRLVVRFGRDSDPHLSEKSDSDSHPHQYEKSDPATNQSEDGSEYASKWCGSATLVGHLKSVSALYTLIIVVNVQYVHFLWVGQHTVLTSFNEFTNFSS